MKDLMMNFKSKIRKNVIKAYNEFTDEFLEFKTRCQGNIEIENKNNESELYRLIPKYLIFEFEEDVVLYQLTFEETENPLQIDAAFYYAPYMPLTITGVKDNVIRIQDKTSK